ncbi:MAG TPA: hypothetical protein VFY03_04420 [Woeseiaceae bacterium]|nr:hypothetical protein [Woeseiaceae bacterium]
MTAVGLAGAFAAATLAFAGAATAQDADTTEGAEIDALEPGVDTSAAAETPAADPAAGAAADAGAEAAEEVTRTESGGYVMDRMELGRTEITGNQELPKVLYILPWQKAEHGDLSGRPVNTLLDEVLAPVDREEFIRTVDYYEEVHGGGE